MNFYKHHLGDYDGHTAHLSWDEDMAYTRLMRAYYRREKGIPDAEKYRLARAATKAHRGAVDRVLNEFFILDGDVWKQKRCDEEIEAYQNQCQKNREIGKLGGRPRKTESVSEENRTVTETVSRNNPNQIPEPEPERTPRKRGTPRTSLPDGFAVSERVAAWAEGRGIENLMAHFENFVSQVKAKGYKYADWDEALMRAVRDDWARIGDGRRRVAH